MHSREQLGRLGAALAGRYADGRAVVYAISNSKQPDASGGDIWWRRLAATCAAAAGR